MVAMAVDAGAVTVNTAAVTVAVAAVVVTGAAVWVTVEVLVSVMGATGNLKLQKAWAIWLPGK